MDYFIENLKETVLAVNKLIEKRNYFVDVKRIRRCFDIKSSNRSKINFIWRSLSKLEEFGILDQISKNGSKRFEILERELIDIQSVLSKI